MAEDDNTVLVEKSIEAGGEGIRDIVVINSDEELLSFALDVLDFGDNIESEEELEHNNSYRILSSLLKKLLVLTIAIEQKYVDRIYRDSYYMHFSGKHSNYDRYCKRLFLFSGNVFEDETGKRFTDINVKKLQEKFVGTVVIRPLKEGKIGRALISPYVVIKERDVFLRYAKYY